MTNRGASCWRGAGVRCCVAVAVVISVVAAVSGVEPVFVPENARIFRMTLRDGKTWRLYRTYEDSDELVSQGPWRGEVVGNRARVVASPARGRQPEGYEFMCGRLVWEMRNGVERKFQPGPTPKSVSPLAGWRKAVPGMMDAVARLDIWKDGARFRLPWGGFINPNKTAALFAELALCAIAVALAASRRRKWWWLVVVFAAMAAASLVLLAKTQSRGGLLAIGAGIAVRAVPVLRRRVTLRGALIGVASLAVLAVLLFAFSGGRFTKGFFSQEKSTDRRMLWRAAPAMMVEAPTGWGSGRSGAAYVDWHQPDEHPIALTELQNSHLTWMVERGWTWRVGYVFLWAFLIAVLLSAAFRDGRTLPAALWTTLWISACFTHELEEPVLWVLPLVSLLLLIPDRAKAFARCRVFSCGLIAAAVSVLTCVTVCMLGSCDCRGKLVVRAVPGGAIANGEEAARWVVRDDVVLDGGYQIYVGKEIRAFYEAHSNAPACGFVARLDCLPRTMDELVLVGRSGKDFIDMFRTAPESVPKAKTVTFLSPPFAWRDVPKSLFTAASVRLFAGDFVIGARETEMDRPDWVQAVDGAELYIPDWLEKILLDTTNNKQGVKL